MSKSIGHLDLTHPECKGAEWFKCHTCRFAPYTAPSNTVINVDPNRLLTIPNVMNRGYLKNTSPPTFAIQFTNPTEILEGKEICSKLLDPRSELCQLVASYRQQLIDHFGEAAISPIRMPAHIEVMPWGQPYEKEEMLRRVAFLQGRKITPQIIVCGKALALDAPIVHGYGTTHITIAHFPDGVPKDWKDAF